MKVYLLLLLISCLHSQQSTRDTPHPLNTSIDFQATAPLFEVQQYFSLQHLNVDLIGKEWYAFVTFNLAEQYFAQKFNVRLYTVSKTEEVESDAKVECESIGKHLTDCFISSSQIDPSSQLLKIKVEFMKEVLGRLKVEVTEVASIELGQKLSITEGQFNKIVRLDVSYFKQKFAYLFCQLTNQSPHQKYQELFYFLASYEEVPPNNMRFEKVSQSYWKGSQQMAFRFAELTQKEVITMTMQTIDEGLFTFHCWISSSQPQPIELALDRPFHGAVEVEQKYHLSLPERKESELWCISITMPNIIPFGLDVFLNGEEVTKEKGLELKSETSIYFQPGLFQLWVNSTIHDVNFTVKTRIPNFITITTEHYNAQLIELKEGHTWTDQLEANQTEHLYFNIKEYNIEQNVTFQIELASTQMLQDVEVKFYVCTQSTSQKCQKDISSGDYITKVTGLTELKPRIKVMAWGVAFLFNQSHLTSYQTEKGQFKSIIVLEVKAKSNKVIYAVQWNQIKPIQQLQPNVPISGQLKERRLQVFYFVLFDTSNVSFARVDFITEGGALVEGSTKLIDTYSQVKQNQNEEVFKPYDNSLYFPSPKSLTNYYIYLLNAQGTFFRMILTLGFKTGKEGTQTSNFISISQQSKNTLLLQPEQILFVNLSSIKQMTIFNDLPLKWCAFLDNSPKTIEDVMNDQFCSDIRINTHIFCELDDKRIVTLYNQQKRPVSVTLVTSTQRSLGQCRRAVMNQRHVLWTSPQLANCVSYQLSHKGDIQIFWDVNFPNLEGTNHPIVFIGSYDKQQKFIMTNNYKKISAEEVDRACKQDYDFCEVQIKLNSGHTQQSQDYVTVFAGYSDKPLILVDGIGHHSQIQEQQSKHFNYLIRSREKIIVSLKSDQKESYMILGTVVTASDKFEYPSYAGYLDSLGSAEKQKNTFISQQNDKIGYAHLEIPALTITSVCKEGVDCHLLLTVKCQSYITGTFMIQATQYVTNLRLNSIQHSYLEEGEVDYYHISHDTVGLSLMILVSSHGEVCHSMALSKGTDPFQNIIQKDEKSQILVPVTDSKIYTLTVTATENCYYSVQATTSTKNIIHMTYGFAFPFMLEPSQKNYYLIRNGEQQTLKVISSISRPLSGELLLRGVAVPDEKMETFLKFLRGDLELGKKPDLEYNWVDVNHLMMRVSDRSFCKECFICVEAEAVKAVLGFLTLTSDKLESIFVMQPSVHYDILLRDEQFVWVFRYSRTYHFFDISLLAGSVEIQVIENDKLIQKKTITFDKTDDTNSSFQFDGNQKNHGSYITIKVKALQNSDYSLTVTKTEESQKPSGQHPSAVKNIYSPIQVGRPKQLFISNSTKQCFRGNLSSSHQEFTITMVSHHRRNQIQDTQQLALSLKQVLKVQGSLNGTATEMDVRLVKSVFLLTFPEMIVSNNQPSFTICLSTSDTQRHRVSFLFLGNLNFLPENEDLHVRGKQNLTFMSEGKGVIEIDQCQNRGTIVLGKQYQDLNLQTNTLNQRRVSNNLIEFTQNGPVYMRVESSDFITLRWKNLHPGTFNGYGYQFYSASSFRIHHRQTQDDLLLQIQPLKTLEEDSTQLPDILQITYKIYIAQQESQLYNGMNCAKGKFMEWTHVVAEKENVGKEVSHQINKLQDLRKSFKKAEYVLISVRAEAIMAWKNDLTEHYRFYYPPQELLLRQQAQIDSPEKEPTGQTTLPQDQSSLFGEGLFIVIVIVVAVCVVLGVTFWLKRKYKLPVFLAEEEVPNRSETNSVEMKKVQSQEYHKQ